MTTLLDVDESIIRKNLFFAENKEEEEINRIIEDIKKPQVPSVVFRPLPGICIKTKTDKGDKIFVNVCHTLEIPAPEDISDEKFYVLLEEDPPSWCIPMSIGHERLESDKSGSEWPTYDVAINTKFFDKCQEKKHFFAFTILTILSAIGEKHNKVIDSENYVVLKNRKVIGKLHDHRVQKREIKPPMPPKPLIEEISTKTSAKSMIKKDVDNSQYVILKKPKEGQVEKLIGFFKLPNQCSKKDVRVDVGGDRIIVDVSHYNYLVDVFVPHSIEQGAVTSIMDENLNILRLDMPVMSA